LNRGFDLWAPAEIKEIFKSLPAHDSEQDPPFVDDFGPLRKTNNIMRLPDRVKLHWIATEEDVNKL
jgi:hypothetical protein